LQKPQTYIRIERHLSKLGDDVSNADEIKEIKNIVVRFDAKLDRVNETFHETNVKLLDKIAKNSISIAGMRGKMLGYATILPLIITLAFNLFVILWKI